MKLSNNNILIGLGIAFLLFRPKTVGASASSVAELSFLGDASLPLSFRNNNPGNLKLTNIPWKGKIPNSQNTDQVFEQFERFIDGARAMILDISNDINVDRANTIRKVISEFAPPSENDTASYITAVSNETRIDPDQIIVADYNTLQALTIAMSRHEAGRESITPAIFAAAYAIL